MKVNSARAIAQQLDRASTAITNTVTDPEIQSLVAVYGYGAERMQEGQYLHQVAENAVVAQAAAAGAQREATNTAKAAERDARESYQTLASVARAIFKRDSAERTTLGLRGNEPDAASEFLAAAKMLFENALAVQSIAARLSEYGCNTERLEQHRASIRAYEQARKEQIAAMSNAVEATRVQTKALYALNKWMIRYRTIATTALRRNPQLAERLGIAVRSTPTAAQRNAATKAAATRAAKRTTQKEEYKL